MAIHGTLHEKPDQREIYQTKHNKKELKGDGRGQAGKKKSWAELSKRWVDCCLCSKSLGGMV